MPSISLPGTVAAALPGAAVAPSDQIGVSLAADPSAMVAIAEGDGAVAFATLLGRQMLLVALPASGQSASPIAAVEQTETEQVDPGGQPADLSVLLQALLLPVTTQVDTAVANPLASATGESRAASGSPAAVGIAAPTGNRQPAVLIPGNGSAAPGQDTPVLADLIPDAAMRPAPAAAIVGKAAEYADLDLPKAPAQRDVASGTPQAAGGTPPESLQGVQPGAQGWPQVGRIEREHIFVSTPVGLPKWSEEVGNTLTMLIGKQASSAELVLTPPHLGRIEVQLSMNSDQTSVAFVAATPAAREALEQALPKLREFLAEAGINLAQASVGGDSRGGTGNPGGNGGNRSGRGTAGDGATESAAARVLIRRLEGVVDTFA